MRENATPPLLRGVKSSLSEAVTPRIDVWYRQDQQYSSPGHKYYCNRNISVNFDDNKSCSVAYRGVGWLVLLRFQERPVGDDFCTG